MRENETNGAFAFSKENNVVVLDKWLYRTHTQQAKDLVKFFEQVSDLLSDSIIPKQIKADIPISLTGNVYGDPREEFYDGAEIITSPIKFLGKDEKYTVTHPFFYAITKSGSRYYLHESSSASVPVLP